MLTPYLIEDTQARYDQHLQTAATYRLAQRARTPQPGHPPRIVVSIGTLLIALGQWMQRARVSPQVEDAGTTTS
jgi:hypothetical protein